MTFLQTKNCKIFVKGSPPDLTGLSVPNQKYPLAAVPFHRQSQNHQKPQNATYLNLVARRTTRNTEHRKSHKILWQLETTVIPECWRTTIGSIDTSNYESGFWKLIFFKPGRFVTCCRIPLKLGDRSANQIIAGKDAGYFMNYVVVVCLYCYVLLILGVSFFWLADHPGQGLRTAVKILELAGS